MEEKILLYPELTEKERLEVEKYVAAHPEWRSALEEAKALDRLLRNARAAADKGEAGEDDLLALYAASRSLPHSTPENTGTWDPLRRRLGTDPELQRRLIELEERRAEIERLFPAGVQFRRLTSSPAEATVGMSEPRNVRYLWRIAAAIVILATAYSVLYKIGEMTTPETERLARFREEELVAYGLEVVRQHADQPGAIHSTEAYIQAIEELKSSQKSFLGLFQTFDGERLERGSALLRQVIRSEPKDSFLASEAAFLLAKAELAAGDEAAARQELHRVIERQGRRAAEAAIILRRLEAD
jgi:hypothetical protein